MSTQDQDLNTIITKIQGDWDEYRSNHLSKTGGRNGFYQLYKIHRTLSDAGFDMTADETYELITDDLDKRGFEGAFAGALSEEISRLYSQGVSGIQNQYVGEYHKTMAHALERLTTLMMPLAEDHIDIHTKPASLPEILWQHTLLVIDQYHRGALKDEMKRQHNLAAQDYYRSALSIWDRHEQDIAQDPKNFNYRTIQTGLNEADNALESIQKADDAYTPEMIPAKCHHFDGYPDPEQGLTPFNTNEIEALRGKFLIASLHHEYELAARFQDEGHYVLDASGSGHGMMVMPMQKIAQTLQKYGYDLANEDTYTVIGTDKQSFQRRYIKERTEVQKDDKYKLIKPSLI